jgi:hypothetical protein
MGYEVVISYRREDSGDARALYDRLGRHFGRDAVFFDTSRIRAGQIYPQLIDDAIRDCKVVLALVTPHWGAELGNPEDWVRRELSGAIAARRPVLPVLMRGIGPPQRADLPAELVVLADTQVAEVHDDDYDHDVGHVIEALEGLGASAPVAQAFVDIVETGRTEARAAWRVRADADHTLELVKTVLAQHGIRIAGGKDGEFQLAGGSKAKARTLGGFFVDESALPLRGRLRFGDRGTSVDVEVLLAEDFGPGVYSGMGGRYSSRFDKVMAALKSSTTDR